MEIGGSIEDSKADGDSAEPSSQTRRAFLAARADALRLFSAPGESGVCAEEQSRRQGALLSSVFADMAEGVVIVDEHGEVQLWNHAAYTIIGEPTRIDRIDEWPTGFCVFEADGITPFPVGNTPLVRALRGDVVTGVVLVLKSLRRPEGVWVSTTARPLVDERGRVSGAVSVFRDITQERKAKLTADTAREDLRRVIESSPDGIVVSRGDVWVFANRVMATSLGHGSPADLLGVRALDLVHPDDRAVALDYLGEHRVVEPARPVELRYLRSDGQHAVMEVSRARLAEFEGAPALLLVLRDVTERKRLHAQLLVSERMASVGTLAAGVAHEFNNPLGAMLANLHMAMRHLQAVAGGDEVSESREFMEAMACVRDAQESGERLRSIARDVKLFSRVEDGPRGPVDLGRVIDSSARIVLNEIRHRARLVKSYADLPKVLAVEARLGQVFLNLLVNAAQSIPEGHAAKNEIHVSGAAHGDAHVAIEISDTGCGMSEDVLRRIFEPFFTTKPAGVGTGLGLSICQRIVSELGGRIEVESSVGVGSRFRVILPAAKTGTEAASPDLGSRGPLRRGKVLVIDDDPAMGQAVRRVLGGHHDVVVLSRAADALERLRSGELFDVILCDMMMPEMGGAALFEEIRRFDRALAESMVFLTGGAFTESARVFLSGVQNVKVEKPFDPVGLRRVVEARLS